MFCGTLRLVDSVSQKMTNDTLTGYLSDKQGRKRNVMCKRLRRCGVTGLSGPCFRPPVRAPHFRDAPSQPYFLSFCLPATLDLFSRPFSSSGPLQTRSEHTKVVASHTLHPDAWIFLNIFSTPAVSFQFVSHSEELKTQKCFMMNALQWTRQFADKMDANVRQLPQWAIPTT